jgi:hypothetical protein
MALLTKLAPDNRRPQSAGVEKSVERERLVRPFRRVLGDLFPKIVLRHRRNVAERPGSLHGGVDSRL